jgi:hypothetical protein
MQERFDKPPVRINNAGVSSVSAADVLRSRAGRAQIEKTLRSSIYTTKDAGHSATQKDGATRQK